LAKEREESKLERIVGGERYDDVTTDTGLGETPVPVVLALSLQHDDDLEDEEDSSS